MSSPLGDVCSYCCEGIDGVPHRHELWKSYNMCTYCMNNLKSCFSCEKKIKKNMNSSFPSFCCGWKVNNLCEECRQLSLICCDKNLTAIMAEILYYLDHYMRIQISHKFIILQNIYTFNKINYDDMNHSCTFEYDHIKYMNKEKNNYAFIFENVEIGNMGNRNNNQSFISHEYSKKSVYLNSRYFSDIYKENNTTQSEYNTERKRQGGIKTLMNELKFLKKRKKNKMGNSFFMEEEIKSTEVNKAKIHFLSPLRYINRNEIKIKSKSKDSSSDVISPNHLRSEQLEDEANIENAIIEERPSSMDKKKGIFNESLEIRQKESEEVTELINSARNREYTVKPLFSRCSSLYNYATRSLLEYIKRLKEKQVEKKKYIYYNNVIYSYKKGKKRKEKQKKDTQNWEEKKIDQIMDKYNLNIVLYFMNRHNESEIYNRLLNNQLKYKDLLYFKNIFNNNSNEKTAATCATCNCVIISKKKLIQLHEQNKKFRNYKYKNLNLNVNLNTNLKIFFHYDNEHIKLIDHLSLTNSIPKISFFFYMCHELMHTYIWLSKIKKSKRFCHIYSLVRILYDHSFPEEKKYRHQNYHQNYHQNLSFYLSPELEEAICIHVSIEFIQHIKKNILNNNTYETELIDYYVRTYECSKSPIYGTNYRLFKKIIRNYKIIEVMQIINDVYCTKFYPVITLSLLQAVISLIDLN
ncbi:hypothetical protein MKS88_004241 [Plasmodium brasilianum]|uniref:Uncharacterized protein n=1 Tax=Plasmodium brasilianum TaxID=5824 RepID=A0ACB9Y4D8_PLABR|nr:hypothetical protein MKS88_004241 [Plasmodium brasilianum]